MTATCPTCHGIGATFYYDEFPGGDGYIRCGRCAGTGDVSSCANDGCPEPAESGGTHCVWCAEDIIPPPPRLPREDCATLPPTHFQGRR